jgi:predicted nucleic acid-binding protein
VATPVRRIVDSSALILLAKVGQLDLLRAGEPEVLVPDAVFAEVGAPGPGDPVFQQIQNTLWLKIVSTPPSEWVFSLPMTWPAEPWRLLGSRCHERKAD